MRTFHLEIVTPNGSMYDGEVQSLLVHTTDGDVEILRGHTDLIAPVDVGRARILDAEGNAKLASCAGGFLSVSKGAVRLVSVTFEFAEEIDVNRAKAAKERAEQALANAKDRKMALLAEKKLARALNRIHVSETI